MIPLLFCFGLSLGHWIISASLISQLLFPSLCPHCPLPRGCLLFWSFPLAVVCSYLAPLSCTQHPVCTGAGQTLSLCDAEDISQAITFLAWARYLYNWVLPAVGVLGEREWKDKKKREGKRVINRGRGPTEGSVSISTRTPLKCLQGALQQFLSVIVYYVEQKDQQVDPCHMKIVPS